MRLEQVTWCFKLEAGHLFSPERWGIISKVKLCNISVKFSFKHATVNQFIKKEGAASLISSYKVIALLLSAINLSIWHNLLKSEKNEWLSLKLYWRYLCDNVIIALNKWVSRRAVSCSNSLGIMTVLTLFLTAKLFFEFRDCNITSNRKFCVSIYQLSTFGLYLDISRLVPQNMYLYQHLLLNLFILPLM